MLFYSTTLNLRTFCTHHILFINMNRYNKLFLKIVEAERNYIYSIGPLNAGEYNAEMKCQPLLAKLIFQKHAYKVMYG